MLTNSSSERIRLRGQGSSLITSPSEREGEKERGREGERKKGESKREEGKKV